VALSVTLGAADVRAGARLARLDAVRLAGLVAQLALVCS
jgi:hypothetical protein